MAEGYPCQQAFPTAPEFEVLTNVSMEHIKFSMSRESTKGFTHGRVFQTSTQSPRSLLSLHFVYCGPIQVNQVSRWMPSEKGISSACRSQLHLLQDCGRQRTCCLGSVGLQQKASAVYLTTIQSVAYYYLPLGVRRRWLWRQLHLK